MNTYVEEMSFTNYNIEMTAYPYEKMTKNPNASQFLIFTKKSRGRWDKLDRVLYFISTCTIPTMTSWHDFGNFTRAY